MITSHVSQRPPVVPVGPLAMDEHDERTHGNDEIRLERANEKATFWRESALPSGPRVTQGQALCVRRIQKDHRFNLLQPMTIQYKSQRNSSCVFIDRTTGGSSVWVLPGGSSLWRREREAAPEADSKGQGHEGASVGFNFNGCPGRKIIKKLMLRCTDSTSLRLVESLLPLGEGWMGLNSF